MKIAVTGLNATDNPGPGVPVIRSIKSAPEFNGKIIGLAYDSLDPGIYMNDLVERSYVIPYPSAGLDSLFVRLKQIHEKEKIDLIIPTLDSELLGFIKINDQLKMLGIRTYLPGIEQLNIRSKENLAGFCNSNNIKVPSNFTVSSTSDLYSIKHKLNYPVMVKGIYYDAYKAHSFDETISAFNKLSSKWGFPIIIQEYIKGDEFNVVALGDGTGETIGAVSMRKLYITDKGKGWAGVTIDDEVLMKVSKRLIELTRWRSGLELEYIKSSSTGEYYLLEINPRFPAWVYLAPSAGQNLPFTLVQLAFDKSIKPYESYDIGTIFVRSSWDLITTMKEFEKVAALGEISL